ncbi:methyltransferase domain-containing protein [Flavobacterium sp.]|uniref:methyltransferase domain-containing protein n=1 Tax=Flavobacterium sp. TaxID=239 RepID=UPI0040486218
MNYWEERYQKGETGWDAGTITTPLKEYIDQLTDKNLTILIPGAGNGHEFDYLINNGFKNVFVVDIAITPLENIKKRKPKYSSHLINADFFSLTTTFDLILEQTFFCALPPEMRQRYVEKMTSLLNPNGKLAGLLFDFPLTSEGPPFGGSKSEYITLFSNTFSIKTLERAYNSIKPRENKELFFIFETK